MPEESRTRARAGRRWIGVVIVVSAVAAVTLRAGAMLGEVALLPYADGSIGPALAWELNSVFHTVPVYVAGALLLARYPPLRRRRARAAAAFVAAILGGVLVLSVTSIVTMLLDGFPLRETLVMQLGGTPNYFVGVTMGFAMVAAVAWSVRFDQVRIRREHRRVETERRLARAAFFDVCRNVQPRFLARCLDALAAATRDPDAAERVLQRIARHVRLLRQHTGERVTLGAELQVLRSVERLSTVSFDIDVPDEALEQIVTKGLAAAVSDVASEESEALRIAIRGVPPAAGAAPAAGAVGLSLVLPPTALRQVDALERRLRQDLRLVRGANLERTATTVLVSYRPLPAELPPVPASPPDVTAAAAPVALGPLLPYLIVLLASTRWMLFPEWDPVIQAARGVVCMLWLGVAPLLWAAVVRFGGSSPGAIAFLVMLTTALAAGTTVAAVEIIAMLTGGGAVFSTATPFWISIPRDASTCATVVAATSLFLVQLRRAADERIRTVRLNALVARADVSALESSFHPHFLFNSLNGVLALLREEPEGANVMAGRLAALVREMLQSTGVQEWSLAEERALAERYLWVMRARFGERLEVVWQFGRGVEHARVPRLVLQPLIENAIRHGVARRAGRGRIAIAVRRAGADRLLLSVENDTPAAVSLPPRARGGLGYTTARVVLLHGEESRPHYSASASSFRVDITTPLRT